MKLVVTGGRDYRDWKKMQAVLDKLQPTQLYVGDATGLDAMAAEWCDMRLVNHTIFTANWDKFGKLAGPIRNEEMLRKAGQDALVVAFPGGRGTANCVREALKLNMTVLRVEP